MFLCVFILFLWISVSDSNKERKKRKILGGLKHSDTFYIFKRGGQYPQPRDASLPPPKLYISHSQFLASE